MAEVPIEVRTVGSAPFAVVLLHAFPLDATMWDDQAALSHEHRLVIPDLRGFGRSPPGAGVATMRDMAGDVLRALDREGTRDFACVGLSMGGYVALALAALAPGRVRGLVLADTRADADAPDRKAARAKFAERLAREGSDWVAADMLPRLLSPNASPDLVARVRSTMERQSPEAMRAATMGMAEREDQTHFLRSFASPALWIRGAEDAFVSAQEMRRWKRAQDDHVEIPGAGHLSNLEKPDWFNEAVSAFLASKVEAALRGR